MENPIATCRSGTGRSSDSRDFERGARTPYPNNLAAIRAALEAAGVEFIPSVAAELG